MVVAKRETDLANEKALGKITASRVFWCDIRRASEVIPELGDGLLLHGGPPLQWSNMCGSMRGAIYGAIVYEGWAPDLQVAESFVNSGNISFDSAHEHSALGPMAGIISPSMPVMVLENETFGNRAYITLNEGLGKTLRFGANDSSVIKRLKWMEQTLAPVLKEALSLSGPIDITNMIERAVQRGDECHNRNKAATSLLIRKLAPWLVKTSFSKEDIAEVLFFLDSNDHFFLNLSMGTSKATLDTIYSIEGSTLVSCIATNGCEFGIKVSGLGNRWFIEPVVSGQGNYFEGYGPEDADPIIGDSFISEAAGIGGVAMAGAPGIIRFVGGTVDEAIANTLEMYKITVAEHPRYKIPVLGFRGTPLGIDIRLILSTGIVPVFNMGIASKNPGVGQIGAGFFRPTLLCFQKAGKELGLIE